MKAIFFILSVAIAIVCIDASGDIQELLQGCMTEVGLQKMDPKDPKFPCAVGCIMEKIGALKDGKINAGPIIEIINKIKPGVINDERNAKIKECAEKESKPGGDKCEVGGKFSRCALVAVKG